jgi:hypothetical protein
MTLPATKGHLEHAAAQGRRIRSARQGAKQPGTRQLPFAIGGAGRDTEYLGGFIGGESAKIARLAARLSAFAGQPAEVGFQAGNLEANMFALDITAALRKARWDVPLPIFWAPPGDVGGAKFGPISKPKTALSILSSSQTQSEALVKIIAEAFNDLGFDAVVDHLPPMQPPRWQSSLNLDQ